MQGRKGFIAYFTSIGRTRVLAPFLAELLWQFLLNQHWVKPVSSLDFILTLHECSTVKVCVS